MDVKGENTPSGRWHWFHPCPKEHWTRRDECFPQSEVPQAADCWRPLGTEHYDMASITTKVIRHPWKGRERGIHPQGHLATPVLSESVLPLCPEQGVLCVPPGCEGVSMGAEAPELLEYPFSQTGLQLVVFGQWTGVELHVAASCQ